MTAFINAFNRLIINREQHISEYEVIITNLADIAAFDEQIARLEMECAAAVAQNLVSQNARTMQNQSL